MRGHLQCRDTLAGNEGCPLKTGTTVTRSLVWGNAAMAVILTLADSARSSVLTEHPGKISSGPKTLFGVPGITGHTICRTLTSCSLAYISIIFRSRLSVTPCDYLKPQLLGPDSLE